jgi:hypothetical protein
MSENGKRDLGELLRDTRLIQGAIGKAVREAVRRHKLLGQPIVAMRDGRVVWIPPEEIEIPDDGDDLSERRTDPQGH